MPQPPKKTKRPDTPLAATPSPISVNANNGKVKIKGVNVSDIKKPVKTVVKSKQKQDDNGGYATGVVISRKDEKAHPEDFKYLKK